MELKTLSRKDPEFESYLRGTFSKSQRALPVQTLNAGSESEQITFQIIPVSEIQRPPFFQLWAQVFRIRNFLYVLFPLYLILVKNVFDDIEWDPLLALLSTLGALSLTVGAFLLNDYLDHVSGVDRVHPQSGSQAIQKGWVTAEATRNWSCFYLILGAVLGAPAVWVFPELLLFLLLPALVAISSWLFPRIGLKYRRGAELVVFFLFGPVLTLGFQVAIGGSFDLEALWIGILTGLHFTFLVHLKNFSSLMVNAQAGFQNTISSLGFERGKKFLEVWWFFYWILLALYQFVFHAPEWFITFGIVPLIFSMPFLLSLRQLKTPVGSSLAKTIRLGSVAAHLTLMLWALQSVWYWLVIELGSPS